MLELLIQHAEGRPITGAEAAQALLAAMAGDDDSQSPGRHHKTRIRDNALRLAADALRFDCRSNWDLAHRLQRAIHRFETRVLPGLWRDAHDTLPPADFYIRRAFMAGAGMPRSQRQLYELLK